MNKKREAIPERVKCEKCGNESATLVKVLSTEKQKKEENENWVYLKDALILIYKCQECGSKFENMIRKE